MDILLLTYTPIDVAYFSAKTCYSSDSAIEMVEEDKSTKEDKIKFIEKILKTGHYSTVEGLNFTFAIKNVSRSLLAQITRHRTGIQFSVQSQRYVKYDDENYNYFIPPTIKNNEKAEELYNKLQQNAFSTYKQLVELGIKAEDARYVLTNATTTNITTTINLRELIHIMGLRRCSRASYEIRRLMELMAQAIINVEPWLKDYLVPQCERLGYCPEGKSCGRKQKLEELINAKS